MHSVTLTSTSFPFSFLFCACSDDLKLQLHRFPHNFRLPSRQRTKLLNKTVSWKDKLPLLFFCFRLSGQKGKRGTLSWLFYTTVSLSIMPARVWWNFTFYVVLFVWAICVCESVCVCTCFGKCLMCSIKTTRSMDFRWRWRGLGFCLMWFGS